jgi:hypothetical protein
MPIKPYRAAPVSQIGSDKQFFARELKRIEAALKHLEDIREGTWVPEITFATPGDFAVTYAAQSGTWKSDGRTVTLTGLIFTSAFTHTTAAGALSITGLPFEATGSDLALGVISFQGITAAGYTQINPFITPGTSVMGVSLSGSGLTSTTLGVAHMPTGGTVLLNPTMTYFI